MSQDEAHNTDNCKCLWFSKKPCVEHDQRFHSMTDARVEITGLPLGAFDANDFLFLDSTNADKLPAQVVSTWIVSTVRCFCVAADVGQLWDQQAGESWKPGVGRTAASKISYKGHGCEVILSFVPLCEIGMFAFVCFLSPLRQAK